MHSPAAALYTTALPAHTSALAYGLSAQYSTIEQPISQISVFTESSSYGTLNGMSRLHCNYTVPDRLQHTQAVVTWFRLDDKDKVTVARKSDYVFSYGDYK